MRDVFQAVRSLLLIDPFGPSQTGEENADALVFDVSAAGTARGREAAAAAAARLQHYRRRSGCPTLLVRAPGAGATADHLLDAVMSERPDAILLADCPGRASLQQFGVKLGVREASLGIPAEATGLLAEVGSSPAGMLGLRELQGATDRLCGLGWDAGALAAACGASLTAFSTGEPAAVLQTVLTLGAAAAGVGAYDTASDAEGEAFRHECEAAWRLGFRGKFARNGAQAQVIAEVFARPPQPM